MTKFRSFFDSFVFCFAVHVLWVPIDQVNDTDPPQNTIIITYHHSPQICFASCPPVPKLEKGNGSRDDMDQDDGNGFVASTDIIIYHSFECPHLMILPKFCMYQGRFLQSRYY